MGVILDALKTAFKWLFGWLIEDISQQIRKYILQPAFDALTKTPYPSNWNSYGPPTDTPDKHWHEFYTQIYQPDIQLWVPILLGLAIGILFFTNIFKRKTRAQTLRRAVMVMPFAIGWWYIGAWFLRFTDAFAGILLADASSEMIGSLSSQLTFLGVSGVFGLLLYVIGAITIFIVFMIYKLRELAIYVYMLAMPLLLVAWVIPINSIQRWAKSMMGKFVPIVLVTLPVALLLRVGAVVISGGASVGGMLTAITMFAGAGLAPKYMLEFGDTVARKARVASAMSRHAVRGARGAGGPNQQQGPSAGNQRPGRQQASEDDHRRDGASDDEQVTDEHAHETTTDFSQRARSRSHRRRQRHRAQKVGQAGQTAASKTATGAASAANRTVESAAKNYYKNENTAKGMVKDAGRAAKEGATQRAKRPVSAVSGRMDKIDKRLNARAQELREEHNPRNQIDPSSQRAAEQGGPRRDPQSSGQSSSSQQSVSKSGRQTYDRNRSGRQVGSLGQSRSPTDSGSEADPGTSSRP